MNKVLKLMKRTMKTKDVLKELTYLKEEVENLEYSADIIVGFPEEAEENFKNTCNFVESLGIMDLHVFKYSEREGTSAAKLTNKVTEPTKKIRAKELEARGQKLKKEVLESYIGKKLSVLIETVKDRRGSGYSENYIRVEVDGYRGKKNEIVEVEITDLNNNTLKGVEVERYG